MKRARTPAGGYGNRLHHLGIGRGRAGSPVLSLVTPPEPSSPKTHQLIASHTIDTNRNYRPNQQKTPGRSRGNL
jgi:hypothetical protein